MSIRVKISLKLSHTVYIHSFEPLSTSTSTSVSISHRSLDNTHAPTPNGTNRKEIPTLDTANTHTNNTQSILIEKKHHGAT